MTPEDIDRLTIAEVRAIAERASEALKTLRELGLAAPLGGAGVASAVLRQRSSVSSAAPTEPYPCPGCNRSGPMPPGERASDEECLHCGNPKPLVAGAHGGIQTNKGVVALSPAEIARKQQLIATPAFDASGEPT